jgi:signal transduction histidine kinase
LLFRNLVSNAIKFRSDEPPEISIRAALDPDGMWWHFSVADNGIGIEPEYAEKVFVIFQRLHSRDEYPGTGIGLSLAKRIVEFHGGSIRLDTGRSRGTAVLFTLPSAKRNS